jgi:hypothetical protein
MRRPSQDGRDLERVTHVHARGRLPEPLAPRSLLVYDTGVEPRQRRMAYRGTTHPEHILAL